MTTAKRILSFGMVIVCGYIGMQKEYKQFFTVFCQTLCESVAVLVPIGDAENVRQPNMKVGNTVLVFALSDFIPVNDQLESFMHQTFEAASKELPLFGAIAQRNLFDLAQQMDDTLLLSERLDPIVGAKEIGDQDPFEEGTKDLFNDRAGPGRSQYVVGQGFARETPDPSGAARDAPAAFVHVEHSGEPCGLAQLVIDRSEELSQPLPIQHQTAGGDLKSTEGSKPGTDVPGRHAEGIVQVSRKQREAKTQGCLRQGLGHRRFNFGSTRRAAVFIDHVLRNGGLHRRDVLDDLAVFAAGFAQRVVTSGAFRELVLNNLIYTHRSWAACTGMSFLATGPAAAL